MLLELSPLHRDRARLLARIRQRRRRIGQLGQSCRKQGRAWAQSPQAVVQAFLAGFMLDQVRPLTPLETSPLKLAMLVAIKRLQALV